MSSNKRPREDHDQHGNIALALDIIKKHRKEDEEQEEQEEQPMQATQVQEEALEVPDSADANHDELFYESEESSEMEEMPQSESEEEEEEEEEGVYDPNAYDSDLENSEEIPAPFVAQDWDDSHFARNVLLKMFSDENWMKKPDGTGNFRKLVVAPLFEREEMRLVFQLFNVRAVGANAMADELQFLVKCGAEWLKEKHGIEL